MFKHILGQAFYQLIILIIVVFAGTIFIVGETFIPEYPDEFDDKIVA
jgi:hypothetical protein